MALYSFKISSENQHQRLDVFLTQHLTDIPSRAFVQKLIEHGHVRVNETKVKSHYKLQIGEDVLVEIPQDFITPQYIAPEDIALDIFYEDEFLLVINKPIGMTVHPAQGCYTGTLVNALLHYSNQLSDVNDKMRPGIVHRLDKETSGLMLVAKDNITHTKLAKQFARHEVKKRYVALVEGEMPFDEGKVDVPIGKHPFHHEKKAVSFADSSKEAVTFYHVLKRFNGKTLVALYPKTGRTHQLRVHMKHLGHPILGDDKYGNKSSFPRLALHAQSISFIHPQTKKYIEFSLMIPPEFSDSSK
ncbi:MAG: RluA family pseudouridine synthase [Candidatus Omnitrophica bacterium]|nr:RluA family pseudouridine synthase [Candidatus Omnitrophota bacterium]